MEHKYLAHSIKYENANLSLKDSPLNKAWAEFYEVEEFPQNPSHFQESPDHLFYAAARNPRLRVPDSGYLFLPAYRVRLQVVLEPFLLHANHEASRLGKQAVVYLQGFGLNAGVPASNILPELRSIYVDLVRDIVSKSSLPNIDKIELAMYAGTENIADRELRDAKGHKVEICTTGYGPAFKRTLDNQVLIASFPFNSNSVPGNGYWSDHPSSSNNAASCSTIAQLQNVHINTGLKAEDRLRTYGPSYIGPKL